MCGVRLDSVGQHAMLVLIVEDSDLVARSVFTFIKIDRLQDLFIEYRSQVIQSIGLAWDIRLPRYSVGTSLVVLVQL